MIPVALTLVLFYPFWDKNKSVLNQITRGRYPIMAFLIN